MYAEDAIVSKLLSLRFYDFTDGDRLGLEKNLAAYRMNSMVSEAARLYLRNTVERGQADVDHLEYIGEWLASRGNHIASDVTAEYSSVVCQMRNGYAADGAIHSYQVTQPRF